jgi:hypothetical protein
MLSDITIIISNIPHYEEIRKQLLGLGISESSIYKAVPIVPHKAFAI